MIKHRVLIVDDVPENLRILLETLKEEYTVIAANCGTKALELATKDQKPDIILLDVMMPDISGFDVCERLKQDDSTKHIPIIFVTTISDTLGEEMGLRMGAVDFITKPIVPGLVLARVRNHLELKRYRDELEQRVQEEIEKRLQQQELLVKQSRLAAMGEMMSVITHQWQQPLNAISISVGILKMDIEDRPQEAMDIVSEHHIMVTDNIKFMTETLKDFKNYFKPTKEKSMFLVSTEVNAILKMVEPQLKIAGIKTSVEIQDGLQIYGRAGEFKQVILNLVSNAKDVIKQNGIKNGRIDIFAKSDGDGVLLELQDNGGGVPQDVIESIFDNYFTTKGEEGTGIGLAMCKMIVEDGMGGKISVQNRGEGACFVIVLESQP